MSIYLVLLAVDFHAVWPRDFASALKKGHPCAVQIALVELAEPLELAVLQLHDFVEVHDWLLGDIPPGKLRSLVKKLIG